jgi:hypothetical protein
VDGGKGRVVVFGWKVCSLFHSRLKEMEEGRTDSE